MGDSLPPPAAIDLVGSYARLKGSDIEIVLSEPSWAGSSGVLMLKKGRVTVGAQTELVEDGYGRRLLIRTPRSELRDGIWSLRLRLDEVGDEPIGARLLVQADRPLALLWGAGKSRSRLPEARPTVTMRSRIASAAGWAVDAALSALPAERAHRMRSFARTAARGRLK